MNNAIDNMERPSFQFRTVLNERYNELCQSIRKKPNRWNIPSERILTDTFLLILNHWEEAKNLPKEDLYMVINCIRLARSVLMLKTHEECMGDFSVLAIDSPYLNGGYRDFVLLPYRKEYGKNYVLLPRVYKKGYYNKGYKYDGLASTFTIEEFKELEENYTNSR